MLGSNRANGNLSRHICRPNSFISLNLSNVVFIGSGIKFKMVFQRMYSIEILQFYVPSVMLCIASACANFVPPELVPGRMGLCVTTFLSTISLFNGAK